MTPFIGSPATQQLPPPYSFKDVGFNYFEVDLSLDTQWRYCDKYLNIGPDWFMPLVPVSFLAVVKYAKMFSGYDNYANYGFVEQNEVYLIFPILRVGSTVGNMLLGWELCWACPFIAVDSTTSAFTGREVLGFHKLHGSIPVTALTPNSFLTEVRLPAFKTFGGNSRQELLKVVDVTWSLQDPLVAEPKSGTFLEITLGHDRVKAYLEKAAEAALKSQDPRFRSIAPILGSLDPGALDTGFMSVVNLKRFRDAQDPSQAVYQGLVSSRFLFPDEIQVTEYEQAEIKIFENDSMKQDMTELGLNGSPTIVPFNSFGFTLSDFSCDVVTDLYTAPSDAGYKAPADDLTSLWSRLVRDYCRLTSLGLLS